MTDETYCYPPDFKVLRNRFNIRDEDELDLIERESGMENVHQRLVRQDFLQGLDTATFAHEAGQIIGDVNHAHPFREGNGRTQLLYLKQWAEQAGHAIDLRRIDRDRWMAASKGSHLGSYGPLEQCIVVAIGWTAGRSQDQR
jgi:cell filamentation protein